MSESSRKPGQKVNEDNKIRRNRRYKEKIPSLHHGCTSFYCKFDFENNHKEIDKKLTRLSMEDKIVLESAGNLWLNLYDSLERNAVQRTLTNPIKTKAIASARIKSDKIESRHIGTYDSQSPYSCPIRQTEAPEITFAGMT